MTDVKVALIGAGSFVFGPSVIAQAFRDNRMDGLELALVDLDAETVNLMAGVGVRVARDAGLTRSRVTAHTDRSAALDGADFVIHSASPQIARRHQMDREIAARFAPGHLVTEFGGIAGISYSLRQIALVEEIAADMRRLCPDAWLLDVANPLPRVCQAAHEAGVKTAGFCSVSLGGYGMLWRLLRGEPLTYPFTAAREALDVLPGGVNHLSWFTSVRDRATGRDLYPEIRERLASGGTTGSPRADALCRETGFLLAVADDHTQDFLAPDGSGREHLPYHGGPDERARRIALLRAVAEGTEAADGLLAKPAWERPLDFVAAITDNKVKASLPSLNLINAAEQVPELPRGVFAETPCTVTADGPRSIPLSLPPTVAPYCTAAAGVSDAIVRAARERRRDLVHTAVDLDPTVTDKAAGRAALDACLEAHADLLPTYT